MDNLQNYKEERNMRKAKYFIGGTMIGVIGGICLGVRLGFSVLESALKRNVPDKVEEVCQILDECRKKQRMEQEP